MTAPGQEPDEVLTRQPEEQDAGPPPAHPEVDRAAIGESHMPSDVRRQARAEAADAASDDAGPDQASGDDPETADG